MLEAFWDLFRPKKKAEISIEQFVEFSEDSENKASVYQIRNIETGGLFRFVGEVYHVPTNKRIGRARGDSDREMVNHAKSIVEDHKTVFRLGNRTIDL